jgi:hypothetical protein
MELADWQAWWEREGREGLNELLLSEWNPIGIGVPRDEYSSYAGQMGKLLYESGSEQDIAAYLHEARTSAMGLPPRPERDRRVASLAIAWYANAVG